MKIAGFAVWLLLSGGAGALPAQQASSGSTAAAAVDTLAVQRVAWLAVAQNPAPGATPEPSGSATLPPVTLSADPDPPFDLVLARRIRGDGLQRNRLARGTADVTEIAAIPGSVLVAALLYGIGELDDRPDLRDLGVRAGQAAVLAGSVSLAGKVAVGRARPRISPEDPYQVGFGRGIRGDDYQSFPSAHTALAFASAVVFADELGSRHPDERLWIVPLSYGAASLAGVSRMFHNHHWASDVLAGALVGVLSGLGVAELHDSLAN